MTLQQAINDALESAGFGGYEKRKPYQRFGDNTKNSNGAKRVIKYEFGWNEHEKVKVFVKILKTLPEIIEVTESGNRVLIYLPTGPSKIII